MIIPVTRIRGAPPIRTAYEYRPDYRFVAGRAAWRNPEIYLANSFQMMPRLREESSPPPRSAAILHFFRFPADRPFSPDNHSKQGIFYLNRGRSFPDMGRA
jgi:hypothetical protein